MPLIQRKKKGKNTYSTPFTKFETKKALQMQELDYIERKVNKLLYENLELR